ncbi:MAG: hypothetical protein WCC86_00350 [Methanoregula sp.]|uniref:hypothetical protein n=1 Tax=Methanoregula sp. TaxID=2052170 RepID=UPI003BB11A68
MVPGTRGDKKVTINDFSGASHLIGEEIPDGERKKDLLQLIKKLEESQNTREYLFYYQQFIDVLNHHIVVCSPVLIFLSRFFP